ncbi:MAG: chemotaxis protein CheX [Phycisphaerae bacterium]|nr:chemotaxis protein CheX [Phycisphaerae bacterium]
MNPNYIAPFVASIKNVFSTMLQLEVNVGEPKLKSASEPTHDVSGIIAMSGEVEGTITLSFELNAATAIVALFCGDKLDPSSPDYVDAVGELVNMVSGGAKAKFPQGGSVSISCPSVIVGAGHTVQTRSDTPCVLIPCTTDCGELTIEVAIRENTTQSSSETASGASVNV